MPLAHCFYTKFIKNLLCKFTRRLFVEKIIY